MEDSKLVMRSYYKDAKMPFNIVDNFSTAGEDFLEFKNGIEPYLRSWPSNVAAKIILEVGGDRHVFSLDSNNNSE